VEEQDYAYNIRGQLASINADYAQIIAEASLNKTFGEQLDYDYGFTTPRYDGNIAGVIWRGGGTGSPLSSYGYTYDTVKRLTAANFWQTPTNDPTWFNDIADYTMDGVTYDEGGNILKMHQRGMSGNKIIDIDQLGYIYTSKSNQLNGVQDGITTNNQLGDFTNGVCSSCTQYNYDADGNLASDLNKTIGRIAYTELDKPDTIIFQSGNMIANVYDANGSLLKKTIINHGHTTTLRYWGPFTFANDSLQYVLHQEGRAVWETDSSKFEYDYFVKDHLGNVRTVVTPSLSNNHGYIATHEVSAEAAEERVFVNIPEVQADKPGSIDSVDAMAAKLNASTDHRVGTMIMLQVMAGDQLDISAQSYWDADSTQQQQAGPADVLEDLLFALTYTATPGALGQDGTVVSNLDNALTQDVYDAYDKMVESTAPPGTPHAFINYMVFDNNMNLVDAQSGAIQVGSTSGVWNPISATGPIVVGQNGYMIAFMQNEENNDVYFDNMRINVYKGKLLQEQHYYPFGLTINEGQSVNTLPNQYMYQGMKMEDEVGMNLYDFHARQYDQQIGRFWSVDPASEFPSGYTGMGNDPGNLVDPSGMRVDQSGSQGSSGDGGGQGEWTSTYTDGMEGVPHNVVESEIGGEGDLSHGLLLIGMAEYVPGGGFGGFGPSISDNYGYTYAAPPPPAPSIQQLQNYISVPSPLASLGAPKSLEDIVNSLSSTSTSSGLLAAGGDGGGDGDKQTPKQFLHDILSIVPFVGPVIQAYLPMPDAAAISVPGTMMGLSGYTGSINFGYVGNYVGVWATGGVSVGVPEISGGIGFLAAYYRPQGNPTFQSYTGPGSGYSIGIDMFSYSRSYGLESPGGNTIWDSYQFNIGGSTRLFTPAIPTFNYTPYNRTVGFPLK